MEEKGADAAKNALAAYANAFKVPGQTPRNLDARRGKAMLSLMRNYPEAGLEICDAMRQALTLGTGSDVIYLTNCKFNDTWGMEPMSGIDIENWTENCSIAEIYCEGCEFANNRIYGLVLATSTYTPMTMHFKDCVFRDNGVASLSILNRPGVPTVTREIFENLKIEGFEGVELLTMVPRANGTEYINPDLFEGVIDFNGKKIDIRKYIIGRGLNKIPPTYRATELDFGRLNPSSLDTAVDAYIPAPFGTGTQLIYWAKKNRVIKLGYFARITGWTKWHKGRAITVQKADGSKEIVAGLDYTNDFTGFFEVPKSVDEVTIQTRGYEGLNWSMPVTMYSSRKALRESLKPGRSR